MHAHQKLAEYVAKKQFEKFELILLDMQKFIRVANPISDTDMIDLMEYLKNHFPDFSPEEIFHALKLAIARVITHEGRKELNTNHYEAFGAVYLSPILIAYRVLRGTIVTEYYGLMTNFELNRQRERPKHTIKQNETEFMVKACLAAWTDFRKNEPVYDAGNAIYKWMVSKEIIDPEKFENKVKQALSVSVFQSLYASEIKVKALIAFFAELKAEKKSFLELLNTKLGLQMKRQ